MALEKSLRFHWLKFYDYIKMKLLIRKDCFIIIYELQTEVLSRRYDTFLSNILLSSIILLLCASPFKMWSVISLHNVLQFVIVNNF